MLSVFDSAQTDTNFLSRILSVIDRPTITGEIKKANCFGSPFCLKFLVILSLSKDDRHTSTSLSASLAQCDSPIDLKNASWFGSLPKNSFTISSSSLELPLARIISRYLNPVFTSIMPFLSNTENISSA